MPSLDRAWQLFQLNRYDLAENELGQVLSAAPDHAQAHAMLGYCLGRRKRFRAAEAEAREAMRCEPDLAYAHYVLAWICGQISKPDRTERAIREALRLWPHNTDYLDLLSWAQAAQGQYQPARETADRGLEIDPRHTGCANCRAIALINLGRVAEAEKVVRRALEIDPEDSRSHANLARVLSKGGKHGQAAQHFREALRLDPEMDSIEESLKKEIDEISGTARVLYAALLAIAFLIGLGTFRDQIDRQEEYETYLMVFIVLALPALIMPSAGLVRTCAGRAFLRPGQVGDLLIAMANAVLAATVGAFVMLQDQERATVFSATVALALVGTVTMRSPRGVMRTSLLLTWGAVAGVWIWTMASAISGMPIAAEVSKAMWVIILVLAIQATLRRT